MSKVKWSAHAMARMREQTRYIAEHSGSREIAWKWASEVFDATADLEKFQKLGHPLQEFPKTPYLEIIVHKHYRVIYRVTGETCLVVTVRRTSMLLDESTLAEFDAVVS